MNNKNEDTFLRLQLRMQEKKRRDQAKARRKQETEEKCKQAMARLKEQIEERRETSDEKRKREDAEFDALVTTLREQARINYAERASNKVVRTFDSENPTSDVKRDLGYVASAAFVDEALWQSNAQRHTRDNIGLTPVYNPNRSYEAERRREEKAKVERQKATVRAQKQVQRLKEVRAGDLVVIRQKRNVSRYHVGVRDLCRGRCESDGCSCLSADAPLALALVGRFERDTVCVKVDQSVTSYQIQSVLEYTYPRTNDKTYSKDVVSQPRSESKESLRFTESADWSVVARDNGAFGSYPKHDDYGDESNA